MSETKQTRSDQTEYLEIESEIARDLAFDDSDSKLYEHVQNTFFDEWRWGNTYELIIKDLVGNYWRTLWRDSSGDGEWRTFDDAKTIRFERVVPKEKVVIEYVLPAYAD